MLWDSKAGNYLDLGTFITVCAHEGQENHHITHLLNLNGE